ncbi:MAG: TIGR02646 family protein, partial [Coriobacteriia bacterium]|nr:TIGR02646 family protein [Coriobacteriia bacterium]
IYPLPRNLSCDAHKNHMNQKGGLPKACEGYLLNPLDVPASPNLFTFNKSTGELMPNPIACEVVQFTDNKYETTYELISRTIEILNLNCDRLRTDRVLVLQSIDKNIKALRQRGVHPSEVTAKLVGRYFNTKWPQYFTTIRCCLGTMVEDYLESIEFAG